MNLNEFVDIIGDIQTGEIKLHNEYGVTVTLNTVAAAFLWGTVEDRMHRVAKNIEESVELEKAKDSMA